MVWYNGTRCNDRRQYNSGRYPKINVDGQKLQEMYYKGTKIKEIAASLNCSIPTIKRHLRLLISPKLRRYKYFYSASNPVNQQIIKLYTNDHYSTLKVASIVGLNDETVRKRLQRLGIELRGLNFKNLETFHPGNLAKRYNKQYPVTDLHEFNQKFIEYYCLRLPMHKIAELLKIDRGTVSRRIKFLKSLYYFKTRICRRCNNFFKFKVTERHKNSSVCGRCRLDYHKVTS